jgi:hypothetical protein
VKAIVKKGERNQKAEQKENSMGTNTYHLHRPKNTHGWLSPFHSFLLPSPFLSLSLSFPFPSPVPFHSLSLPFGSFPFPYFLRVRTELTRAQQFWERAPWFHKIFAAKKLKLWMFIQGVVHFGGRLAP